MKIRRKVYGALLTLCLITGMIPATVFAAGEDANKAIQLDTGGISGYSDTEGYDYIYFATWENSPVKWKVLDDQTNTGTDGLFLLSDELIVTHNGNDIDGIEFDDTSNEWQGSNAQSWCKDFATASFTDTELSAVIKTVKDDEEYTTMGNQEYTSVARNQILNGDQIFFISLQEVMNPDYGFSDDSSRIAYFDETTPFHWYIRSKIDSSITILLVEDDGEIQQYLFNTSGDAGKHILPVRPAFNMDTSNVLFTSAAQKEKVTGTGETLSSVSDYTGNEWKLTLLDGKRSSFTVAGNVLYYGNLAQNSESGTATLNIPSGLAVGSYTLKVFSEQCNGDYKTDYASAFQEISLTVILPRETTPQATFSATGDNGGTLSNVEPGMKYSTDGGANWNDITGTTIDLTGVTAENDVKVYQSGDGTTTSDSDIQTIDVTLAAQPAVSGVDCTTVEQNDGKLTGVDSTMEYRLSTASKWTEITDTEVTGLADGTYEVRVKANGTVLASTAATVTIGEHTCAAQGGWQSDADGHWKLCTCGAKLDSAAHRFVWVTDKEATAADAGSRHEECTACGYQKAAVEIPATGTAEEPSEPSADSDTAAGGSQSGNINSPQTGDNSNITL